MLGGGSSHARFGRILLCAYCAYVPIMPVLECNLNSYILYLDCILRATYRVRTNAADSYFSSIIILLDSGSLGVNSLA